jgi:hypothetical protein
VPLARQRALGCYASPNALKTTPAPTTTICARILAWATAGTGMRSAVRTGSTTHQGARGSEGGERVGPALTAIAEPEEGGVYLIASAKLQLFPFGVCSLPARGLTSPPRLGLDEFPQRGPRGCAWRMCTRN